MTLKQIALKAFICSTLPLSLAAQEQEPLTLEQAVMEQRSTLAPNRISGFSWMPKGEYLFYKDKTWFAGKGDKYRPVDKQKWKIDQFDFTPYLKIDEAGNRYFTKGDTLYRASKKGWSKQAYKLSESSNTYRSPDGKSTACITEKGLYILAPDQLTLVEEEQRPNHLVGNIVHRYEFGLDRGVYWAPKSGKIAYYVSDESAISDYPILNTRPRVASVENIKYPMSGMASEKVGLQLYDLSSNSTVSVQLVKQDSSRYLTNIVFSPDESILYIAEINRGQDTLWYNAYSAERGTFIETLFQEVSKTYVQPLHPAIFDTQSEETFFWRSRKSGYWRLHRFDQGKETTMIPTPDGDIDEVLGQYKDDLYFTTFDKRGLNTRLFRYRISENTLHEIKWSEGIHRCTLDPFSGAIYDSYSNIKTPFVAQIISASGETTLLHTSSNPLIGKQRGETRLGYIVNANGDTLNTRTIFPHDFDSTKTYPALIYVYNGPHVQLVTNRWNLGAPLWMTHFANKGNIVFTVDGRGSDHRGTDFENIIHRNLGVNEMEDQMAGYDYLAELPFIDSKNISVHGWSFGGFMTTGLLLTHPGKFASGVAGGPVLDWSRYEVMYTERYMDTPEENPEGYANAAWLNQTEKLEDPLLLIHGTADDVVLWQHSIEFVRRAVSNGVQIDYFMYPGHPHNVYGPDRVHLIEKVLRYVENHRR